MQKKTDIVACYSFIPMFELNCGCNLTKLKYNSV